MPLMEERIVTAAWATGEYLRACHTDRRVYALAEPSGLEEFAEIELVPTPEEADVVVLGGPDHRWTYETLDAVFRALLRGASLVAMHRNRWWTTSAGATLDAGMYVAGLEYAVGGHATVIGKPSPAIYLTACACAGVDAADVMMVGDDLESDLRPARRLGMATCLVRTGKGATFTPLPDEVDLNVDDLRALADLLLDPAR